MQEEFYEALGETFTPAEILERYNISWEDFLFYFKDYLSDNAKEFEEDFPEYFYKEV